MLGPGIQASRTERNCGKNNALVFQITYGEQSQGHPGQRSREKGSPNRGQVEQTIQKETKKVERSSQEVLNFYCGKIHITQKSP